MFLGHVEICFVNPAKKQYRLNSEKFPLKFKFQKKIVKLYEFFLKIDFPKSSTGYVEAVLTTLLSQYIREAYEHKERKGHPQIA